MAKVYDDLSSDLQQWIEAQHIFFVATAPLDAAGHVNLSPKGLDCLRILNAREVAYLDLTGSGNETSAHISENGRITLMWCAVQDAPRILRIYGRGCTVLPGSESWDALSPRFSLMSGTRQIIHVEIERVQTSCGFAVPLFDYAGERDALLKWADHQGPDGLSTYRTEHNARSIDGLSAPLK